MSSVAGVRRSIEMRAVFALCRLLLITIASVSLLLAHLSVLAAIGAVVCLWFGWEAAPRFVSLRLAGSLNRRLNSVQSLVASGGVMLVECCLGCVAGR